MRSIRHPHILLFYGAGFLPNGHPFLVTELMERGSLFGILHDTKIALVRVLVLRLILHWYWLYFHWLVLVVLALIVNAGASIALVLINFTQLVLVV